MGSGVAGLGEGDAARAVAEGALLGLYTFNRYKKPEDSDVTVVKLVVRDGVDRAAVDDAVMTGTVLAEATNMARDMVNEPANVMTPTRMGEIAKEVGQQYGLNVHVMDSAEMKNLGMGALLGVAQGSCEPPAFIRMDYRGADAASPVTALVGKAITFDSGGISIKPSEGLAEMKDDMSGGAAVIAAMTAVARLKLKANVTGLVPATENLPGGKAFRPGDILKSLGGKTIEVISTDAEGRLALADAIDYARKEGMSPIVDIATLTGACRVALGNGYSGLFGNRDDVVRRFKAAAREAGERVWQLPLPDDYRELNKSPIADIKNTGNRYGGAITAALFLSEFAGDVPWLHLDIAGTANSSKDSGATLKGATGAATRTLFEFVRTPSA
jgi:leucyl aminopeptidase